MNRRILNGALLVLVAGVAAYFYKRNKGRINEAAANAYNDLNKGFQYAQDKADDIFS